MLSGNQVRLVRTAGTSMAIAYKHGGKMIQVIGSAAAPVLRVTAAYLAARAGQ